MVYAARRTVENFIHVHWISGSSNNLVCLHDFPKTSRDQLSFGKRMTRMICNPRIEWIVLFMPMKEENVRWKRKMFECPYYCPLANNASKDLGIFRSQFKLHTQIYMSSFIHFFFYCLQQFWPSQSSRLFQPFWIYNTLKHCTLQ